MDSRSHAPAEAHSRDPRAAAALGLATARPRGTPRFLGQVVGGAAMPGGTDQVYLVNPVRLDGPKPKARPRPRPWTRRGSSPWWSSAERRPRPATSWWPWPWAAAGWPSPGRLLARRCTARRAAIPRKNLTLSWTNALIGPGSTPLVYQPPGQWNSACTNQLLFSLACPGSWIKLSVTYFLSGFCPTGQSQSCVSPGYDPFTLSLDGSTCSPFFLHYTVTGAGCPVLWSGGYASFTITE